MSTSVEAFDQTPAYSAQNADSLMNQPVNEAQQPWGDDMLEFLLSDFSSGWPLSLPIMQFETPLELGVGSSAPDQQNGPGHLAVQQMSRLIAELSSTLITEIESTGITSAFLDTCMHVFFEKFIPSFPVLHKPSFLVRESSHPLLLNIIALGSLFVGAKDALPKGEALWRLAHTAVATSWQTLMATKGPRDECNGVQLVLTALLGQTYAILSKNESLRMTSQVFHGLGFYWARQCGMFDVEDFSEADLPALDAPESLRIEAWRSWAAKEVMKRAVLGHYILDGQICEFSSHPPCTRHVTNSMFTPSPDPIFSASTVDSWMFAMRLHSKKRTPFRDIFVALFSDESNVLARLDQPMTNFSVRVVLEGLQSLASDAQDVRASVGTPKKIEVVKSLLKLQKERLPLLDSSVETVELLVRWHTLFLNLASQSTTLCQRLCYLYGMQQQLHGQMPVSSSSWSLHSWVRSVDGLRALLHAMAIQDLVERLPLGRSHAIHLPAAIFAVSTVYSARCLAGYPTVTVPKTFSWQDVWEVSDLSDRTSESDSIRDIGMFLKNRPLEMRGESSTRNLLYELNSLQITLSSISLRWGVSHAMDDILHTWIMMANESPQPVSQAHT